MTYIFKKMSHDEGLKLLKEDLQPGQTISWLVRESTKPGMLTIDYIQLDKKTQELIGDGIRMALTHSGDWIDATIMSNPTVKAALTKMVAVTPEVISDNAESLKAYIANLHGGVFTQGDLLKPTPEQRSKEPSYAKYAFAEPTQARTADRNTAEKENKKLAEKTREDFYSLLGVNREASDGDISTQIRKMKAQAKTENNSDLMGRLNEASTILRDKSLREIYDKHHSTFGTTRKPKHR